MKVLGVNGGNGVILFPFKSSLIANIEPRALFKTPKDIQWNVNFGGISIINSNPKIIYSEIEKLDLQGVNLLIGAPDCGHSSVLSYSRKKTMGNPRANFSLNLFFSMVNKVKPDVWVMENLPALLKTIPKQEIKANFRGYKLLFIQAPVSKWGNSQVNRVRLLIIGVKTELWPKLKPYITHMPRVRRPKVTKHLLYTGEYGVNGHIRESGDEKFTMYAGFKITPSEAKQIWLTTKDSRGRDIKRWLVHDRKFTTAPGVYRNIPNDYPATARKANRQFNPDGDMMTPRELAKIQGLPDRFKIYCDNSRPNYWINKGRTTVTKTPPMEIGLSLKIALKKSGIWD